MKLSKINNLLLGLIILVNAYTILAPLWPAATYKINYASKSKHLRASLHATPAASQNQPNHLVVPSMLLDQPVYEEAVANQYKILDQGIWRWPAGSTPDKGGNTVLIGHRFTYTNPQGVFYHLDKVHTGDEIGLFWNNHEYLYKVAEVKVVPSTDTSIEDSTQDVQLTLFTCTPLWHPKDRLVVIAKPEVQT